MSTNPFRRDQSLQTSNPNSAPPNADIFNHTRVVGDRAQNITVDTRVPAPLDRHVSFASPPVDVTIPAVSYPSSPEETRPSPHFQNAGISAIPTTDYSVAIQSDPFQEGLRDDGDIALREALQNAQNNTTLTERKTTKSQEDAIRNTLSKFAGPPRKPAIVTAEPELQPESRQTMDVDAFKRMLLTGKSVPNSESGESGSKENSGGSDSNLSVTASSASQQSILQFTTQLLEGPANTTRDNAVVDSGQPMSKTETESMDLKKKNLPPPTPLPRRAKSVKKDAGSGAEERTDTNVETHHRRVSPRPGPTATVPESPKKPPTPPLSRRHSAKSGTPEAASPRLTADPETASISSLSSNRVPPPPPPSRRRESYSERKPSRELAPTAEEPDSGEMSQQGIRMSPPLRPLSQSRKSGEIARPSSSAMEPPPLPPPRRTRRSSRSSIDSHRQSLMSGVGSNSERTSGEFLRPEDDGRRVSTSNANSILADLAALQKELDEARSSR